MKKKILILDIDGTLTNSKKEISPKTLKALLEIEQAGATIIIATGRPAHGVKWIADTLKLSEYGGYVLCFNGARITDEKSGEVVFQQKFPKECIAPLYDYAVAHNMGMVTYEGDTVITGTRIDAYMEFEARLNFMKLQQIDNFETYVTFDVNKCLFTAEEAQAPQLEREMAEAYAGKLSIYRSEAFFIEAMPLGVDKAASLDRLFDKLCVSKEDAVACGDGFNDMSMIEYAGIGVAMANAKDEVKAVADMVTQKTNDEDGLLEVIDRYFR